MENKFVETADNSSIINETLKQGAIRISNDVIAVIAGIAALEIEGVAGLHTGITSGITEIFGKKNPSKGVKVELLENVANVEVQVALEYGVPMMEVAVKIQENVRKAVETMTNAVVAEVNVRIQGVNFKKENTISKDYDEITK